jgi:UDP-2,3-diacylglucosamine pyrophosphatase LpxH
MIVIASDIHLTDGSSGETIHRGAFATFRQRLNDMAYDASWRDEKHYRPIEELHVVLLGDILDVIRSCEWLKDTTRPWSPRDDAFAKKISTITTGILTNNAESLAVLKSLTQPGTITIPDTGPDGKAAQVGRDPDAPGRVPVTVHIHYVVGNHDWFFHVPDPAFNPIRSSIVGAIGLDNSPDTVFPHDPCESSALQTIFHEHKIWARHGDIYDSFNYEHDRNASSLGDAIVIELLNRFPAAVGKQLGNAVPPVCALGLREIDNVRPLLLVPVWIHSLLRKTCPDPMAKKIKDIWDELVDQFLNILFVKNHHAFLHLADDYSKLEWALKFSKGVSLGNLSKVVDWVYEKVFLREGGFYPNAFMETEFKNRNARFIVYGHTHQHEIVPLDSFATPAGVFDQMYINSGTWRAVHEQAQLHPAEQDFVGYHVMTYLAFFKDDERMGRAFESWSGALTKS